MSEDAKTIAALRARIAHLEGLLETKDFTLSGDYVRLDGCKANNITVSGKEVIVSNVLARNFQVTYSDRIKVDASAIAESPTPPVADKDSAL